MLDVIDFRVIQEMLPRLNSFCDIVRVVDPISKKVVTLSGDRIEEFDGFCCYDYWNRGEVCYNCISTRAFADKKSYVKLEIKGDCIKLITAIPAMDGPRPLVVELIKDVTTSIVTSDNETCEEAQESNHLPPDVTAGRLVRDLNDLAVKDHLTGLYNRRFISTRLESDIIQTYIAEKPLSVMFIDADNFKSINDKFGHVTGDEALVKLADVLKRNVVSDGCWTARYGGDEFFVSLNHLDEEEALKVAQAIRTSFGELNVPNNCSEFIKLSASIGLYTLHASLDENNKLPEKRINALELIKLTDDCMYKAKQLGRNTIYSCSGIASEIVSDKENGIGDSCRL